MTSIALKGTEKKITNVVDPVTLSVTQLKGKERKVTNIEEPFSVSTSQLKEKDNYYVRSRK